MLALNRGRHPYMKGPIHMICLSMSRKVHF